MFIAAIETDAQVVELDAESLKKSRNGKSSGEVSIAQQLKAGAKALTEQLKNLDQQIELAENEEDWTTALQLQTQARELIGRMVEQYLSAGYSSTSTEVLKLKNQGYDYARDQQGIAEDLWNRLFDAVDELVDAAQQADALLEKQQAVETARQTLEQALEQRSVRVYNPEEGRWEWVADEAAVSRAEEALETAQSALQKEQLARELEELKAAGTGDDAGAVLQQVSIGPALAEVLAQADEGSLAELARALGEFAAAETAPDSAEARETAAAVSDSHDVNYVFPGGITLTAEQAQSLTLADLADRLTALKLVT